ncbi:L-idonate 5-dehydrogenase [Brucella anthropi]|jgi:L-idonate 5-dehydrogenase|uniref:L-idonate 5-dehydrogenase n=1 Tax=Brucella anthropi TaxID=529 RepID=A0A6I0DTW2_BRUAN|nr:MULTISPECIES: L-idonate 5-dehydrogenase [Brucella/Ochrobactrum group]MCR5939296.1 L-idonate 5-dehydrogenase [Ochrobactrum sp. XJ1]KAB2731719.1 L-idonate 5-dehydrogenase [Brucella anthropi]KAB2758162.1 L-idonate 5-dehydrogenase [Brucella anthropi]KAB2764604.1 L-idonate 5-dehydrogenase [Brucella anthropi]KAB2769674.1 L-idonate 5-dehydrogenase [Brucella anthropi]
MTELSNTRVICLHAQDDLRIESRPVGTPGPGEVLVAVEAGGICGSDLHYWLEGGIGTIRVREPIILGHEASGRIKALGEGVTGLVPGQLVAMNPSQPCGTCSFCQQGLTRHCSAMRFKGSAMYLPHQQGMFRDRIVIAADQCFPVPNGIDPGAAACSEPLAVCLHAANRGEAIADSLVGKVVMVTGAGPIGALCVAVARQRGASEIIVTDIQDATLAVAARMGADHTVNIATDPTGLARWQEGKGKVDLVFECSAAAPAIGDAISCLRPLGTLVQVGVGGPTVLPLNVMVGKEIQFVGSQRFDTEFAEAVRLIGSKAIDPRPIITATIPLTEALSAFQAATDRTRSVKVQISFADASA